MTKSSFAEGVFDNISNSLKSKAATWEGTFKAAGLRLFWILAGISITWTGCELVLKKADIGEFFAQFIRLCLFLGFFLFLVSGAGVQLANAFLESMMQVSSQAGGSSTTITPSGVVGLIQTLWQKLPISGWSPIDSLGYIIVFLAVALVLAYIAAQYLLTLATAYVVIYSGIILLGFGGSRWTSDIVINYFKTVANICLQILVILLLIVLSKDIVFDSLKGNIDISNIFDVLQILAQLLIIALMVMKLPPLIGGMIGGGGGANLSAGEALGAAAAGLAAAAAGVAAVGAQMKANVAEKAAGAAGGENKGVTGLSGESSAEDKAFSGDNSLAAADSDSNSEQEQGSAFSDSGNDTGGAGGSSNDSDGGQGQGSNDSGGDSADNSSSNSSDDGDSEAGNTGSGSQNQTETGTEDKKVADNSTKDAIKQAAKSAGQASLAAGKTAAAATAGFAANLGKSVFQVAGKAAIHKAKGGKMNTLADSITASSQAKIEKMTPKE